MFRVTGRILAAFAGALVLVAGAATPAAASAGELDDTFDGNGKLLVNASGGSDFFVEVAIQPLDQKIVAVGGSDPGDGQWEVYRFNPDGTFDATFGGGDGRVSIDFSTGDDYANALAIQEDGGIVVVGLAGGSGGRWGIARLTASGAMDTTFSGDGKATLNVTTGPDVANDVAIDSSQRIVIAGSMAAANSRFMLARYTTTGALDTSFSGDGISNANLTTGQDVALNLALAPSGNIVVVGYASGLGGQIGLARFLPTGALDVSFSGDGRLVRNINKGEDVGYGVAVQPADEKVVVVGQSGGGNPNVVALRYNASGSPDSTFNGDGLVAIDITRFRDVAFSVGLQADGKVVLGGTANYEFFTVLRLTTAGQLDTAFGDDGVMFANVTADYDVVYSLAIQADGKIVAAGESAGRGGRMSIARFLAD